MSKKLATAITAAEQEFKYLAKKAEYLSMRAMDAKNDMTIAACLADNARMELNSARRALGTGYLRLMTSGISHRAFLAFVRRLPC